MTSETGEVMKEVLATTNEWLKFAESKNGALVALSSGAMFLLLSMIETVVDYSGFVIAYYFLVLTALGIATVLGLLSFIPQLTITTFFDSTEKDEQLNVLYFGHIARYSPANYFATLSELVEHQRRAPTQLESLQAQQLITNSRIAIAKFKTFSLAAWVLAFGLLTPIGGLILLAFVRRTRRSP